MNSFNRIVITIAIIILIILLIIIGIQLYNKKYNTTYPPVTADCPDYWLDESTGNSSKCVNYKNLGSCNVQEKDFSVPHFSGTQGLCNKKKWARSCNLTWDGITNNTALCSKPT